MKCIHTLFEEQVALRPQATAVTFGDKSLTYQELNRLANQLAHFLQTKGVQPDQLIATFLDRTDWIMVTILGILKSGSAYVPLDPIYPKDRLGFILDDCQTNFLLTTTDMKELLPNTTAEIIFIDEPWLNEQPTDNPTSDVKPEHLIYAIYTSGSTGKPKGVLVNHENVVWLFDSVVDLYGFNSDDVWTLFHSYGFDFSVWEMWGALLHGGRLVIVPTKISRSPQTFYRLTAKEQVTVLCQTPSAFRQYIGAEEAVGQDPSLNLRYVIMGGESLEMNSLRPWFDRHSDRKPVVINGYGITETTVFTNFRFLNESDLEKYSGSIIGFPMPNWEMYILDENRQPVPQGEVGEIYIGGVGVTRGYLNRPELHAERFIDLRLTIDDLQMMQESNFVTTRDDDAGPNRKSEIVNLKLYKSGDLAKYLPDGDVEYMGRIDHQIQLRGFRVELGEVEAAVGSHPAIREVYVMDRKDRSGETILVAYIIADEDEEITVNELRHFMGPKVPDYMVPTSFIFMDEFPLTVNGKVDRKALPEPGGERPNLAQAYIAPSTPMQAQLREIWAEYLNIHQIGIDDSFFELGGNSLFGMRVATAIEEKFDIDFSPVKLIQYPTLRKLGGFLDTQVTAVSPNPEIIEETAPEPETSQGIAIIGMNGRFPGADSVNELWQNLLDGVDANIHLSEEEQDPNIADDIKKHPNYVPVKGMVNDADKFDARFFGIMPREAELMDPQHRVFLEVAWAALEDAGYAPTQTGGVIGLFAGVAHNTYYKNNVSHHPDREQALGSLQVMLGNDKDFINTRTSYKLNLTGPSLNINTACSTSLIAVIQAFKSLMNKECDMALAGGATINSPLKSGYVAQNGGMLSPDGRCRPFDAKGNGTLFNDGVGVIVLKRVEDALSDGDHIEAVIRGVGINNDGADKVSFTAPSVEGQSKAIEMAIDSANINPETISYIEAHGTATQLGDPSEIEALTMAYRKHTDKKGFVAIGSVKGNVGHLVAASGITGLIKTALALKNKKLPPSLYFETPNPNIDFDNSPFFVNSALRHWGQDSNTPRRAGVSSFGVGGTNAHIILEEAPQPQITGSESREWQLLPLSAKSEESLDTATERLVNFFKTTGDSLADAAFTLQNGRTAFPHRRFVITKDNGDASNRLAELKPPFSATRQVKLENPDVIFMFPGQGAQYINMGAELYESEPLVREIIDACADILKPMLARDIRELIFTNADDAQAQGDLKNTLYTQPALFVIEYAIAKLWQSWGIEPNGLIGHSVGEFVAGTLAGVFSLKAGLKLIATRAKMMEALPTGSMLSVREDASTLEARLPEGLALAASNAPGASVVSGPDALISQFAEQLTNEGIASRELQTSHAFHSAMVDPIVKPFEAVVSQLNLSAPQLPIISTVTGTWMKDSEAIDPAYWANQLRAPVRFADAVATAWERSERVLLEVGPRNSLTTLARRQMTVRQMQTAVPSLEPVDTMPEMASMLKALGRLWLAGVVVDWSLLTANESRVRISLPTYAFARTKYWVEPKKVHKDQLSVNSDASTTVNKSSNYPITNYQLPTNGSHTPEPQPQTTLGESPMSTDDRQARLMPMLYDIFEEVSGIDVTEAESDTTFMELGFDSLFLTQIALALKNKFKVEVTLRQMLESVATFPTLAEYLDAELPADAFPAPDQAAPVAQPAANLQIGQTLPAMNNAPVSSDVANLIQQQLNLMQQQLAILKGGAVASQQLTVNNQQSTAGGQQNPVPGPQSPIHNPEAPAPSQKPKKMQPFGAIARINTKKSSDLTEAQQEYLKNFMAEYIEMTKGSKKFTQDNRQYHADPRAVTGFKPATKEIIYPIVVKKSDGTRFYDVDDNEYIDVLNGFGSNFLGYNNPIINEAAKKQIDLGMEIGPQQILTGEVAKMVSDFTSMERVGFCNTGSEAVLGCMRLARTHTGRKTIAIFAGSYHGIFDEVLVRGTKTLRTIAAAPGIMPENVQNIMVLDYGTDEALEIIKERADELAAVLVEPIQSRRPDFQPHDFLHELRKVTADAGTLLIFDEVITGFRMGHGGAQAFYNIQADLASYGKVVGGGMPIGVIAGNSPFIDGLDGGMWQFGDDSVPEAGVTYFAGTFVRHPLAMAAAHAMLTYMQEVGPELNERLNAQTTYLANELNSFFKSVGAPIKIKHFSSLYKTFFTEELLYQEILFYKLRTKGIHIYDGFPCFVTAAFTDEDIETVINAFKESVRELQAAGFIPASEPTPAPATNGAQEPPVPGARLGRTPSGEPAWFIPDPDRPGKYLQLELGQTGD
ncbi:MAG: amino acid adenylation domain-containing protein [Chloroflexota bacterium]